MNQSLSALGGALGFHWEPDPVALEIPVHSVERACARFQKSLAEFVWDASALEGNPCTYPEVQTLLDGVTVGGRKIADQAQVLNLAASTRRVLEMVRSGSFTLSKETFLELHALVAHKEALEWGVFRGEGKETNYTPDVFLGELGRYTPVPTENGAPNLNRIFEAGLTDLEKRPPFERALAMFLFGALQQFFFDGNKRTSRLMMNGVLMSSGIDAISVPASKAQEFNEKMARFYSTKDASEMMIFLADCHPEGVRLRSQHSRKIEAIRLRESLATKSNSDERPPEA